jgi:hypothetical protein
MNRRHPHIFLVLLTFSIALLPVSAFSGNKVWKNNNTDWNTNGSWTPSGEPAVGDVAVFDVARVTNPNLSASRTIQELNFSTTASSGYTLSSSSTAITLTLTNTGTGTTSAINAANTSGTNTISAPLILGAAASSTQTFTQASGGTLTLNGNITRTNAITLNIAGGGTVLVNGTVGTTGANLPVTVNGSGTTLGGTGTINGSVQLGNTTPGAVLNAGPQGSAGTSASVGTLHTGALTLTGANTFHVDAFGTAANQWDQVVVSGSAALGTTSTFQLSIPTGLNFQANTTYTLIDATSITGNFSGYLDGQTYNIGGYDFTVHYGYGAGNGNFELTAIPEPSTWIAAALTLLAIGFTQRRKVTAALGKLSPEGLSKL